MLAAAAGGAAAAPAAPAPAPAPAPAAAAAPRAANGRPTAQELGWAKGTDEEGDTYFVNER